MPLPTDPNMAWPPEHWAPITREHAEASAWYSGDEKALTDFYGDPPNQTRPSERPGVLARAAQAARARFWGRRADDQCTDRQRLHIPAAADIAVTGATLLFGEPPTVTIPEAHDGNDTAAHATEDRLAELIERDGIASTLLEAAEVCGALGDVYLRPLLDPEIAEHPILTVVHADNAIPEWRWGRLVAVTFWSEVARDGGEVWRHLERHEPGVILHGLYVGRDHVLGARVPLDAHEATAGLAGEEVTNPHGINGLMVRHVPNSLPNPRHRKMPVGRADTQGAEALMDALDETWSSWMRDIRLGKGRVLVPGEFLERRGRGQGAAFDLDAEVFSPLEMDPTSQDRAGISVVQFDIRTEQHSRTSLELFEAILRRAGYSPQSFGMAGDGGTQTATEVDARESRSEQTTARKQRYWRKAVEDALWLMLVLDREAGSGVDPYRPRLEFPDSSEAQMGDVAQTLNLLTMAQAASAEVKVRMVHPEWDDTAVQAEVARIHAEAGTGPVDNPVDFPA